MLRKPIKRIELGWLTVIFLLAFFLRILKIKHHLYGGFFPYQLDFLLKLLTDPIHAKSAQFIYTPFYIFLLMIINKIYFLWGALLGYFYNFNDVIVSFNRDYSGILLAHRVFGLIIGAITIPVIYLIAKVLFSDTFLAIISAFLLAVIPLHVGAHFEVRPDILQSLFVCLSFLYACRILQEKACKRHYVMSGIFIGLATASRYSGILCFIPLAIAHFLKINGKGSRKYIYIGLSVMILTIIVTFFPVLLHLDKFLESLRMIKYQVIDKNIGSIYLEHPYIGWINYLLSLRGSLGTGIFIFSVLGFLLSVLRHSSRDIIMLSLPVSYYLLIGNVKVCAVYHTLLLVPFAILFSINFLSFLQDRFIRKRFIVFTLAACITLPSLRESIYYLRWIAQDDIRPRFEKWFKDSIPINSNILVASTGDGTIGFGGINKTIYNFTIISPETNFNKDNFFRDNNFDYIIVDPWRIVPKRLRPFFEYIEKDFILIKEFKPLIRNPEYNFCNLYNNFYHRPFSVYRSKYLNSAE